MANQSSKIIKQTAVGNRSWEVEFSNNERWVFTKAEDRLWATCLAPERLNFVFEYSDLLPSFLKGSGPAKSETGEILSPSQGRVQKIRFGNGDEVKKGDIMVVLESMKMEISIHASQDGKVQDLSLSVGEVVKRNQKLLRIMA